MQRLEDELQRARDLDVTDLADAIEAIGFECTRCGACCKGYEPDGEAEGDGPEGADAPNREDHTATVFPDEVRQIRDGLNGSGDGDGDGAGAGAGAGETGDENEAPEDDYDWRDVARPTPYGLHDGEDGPEGETFEWALAVDDCGDCSFYEAGDGETDGACSIYGDRPLVCRTYPFSVALGGVDEPMGEVVEESGVVRAHECEGLGRDISRAEAEDLAETLKKRAVREIEEAIAVREAYAPVDRAAAGERVVVHDSEGPKRADGTPLDGE